MSIFINKSKSSIIAFIYYNIRSPYAYFVN